MIWTQYNTELTVNLLRQPVEGFPGELLIRSSVVKGIGYVYTGKVFEDSALHGKFVEVGIQEGDYSLRVRGRRAEIHDCDGKWGLCS